MSPERVNDVMNPFGPYRKECDSTLYSIKLVEEISEVNVLNNDLALYFHL